MFRARQCESEGFLPAAAVCLSAAVSPSGWFLVEGRQMEKGKEKDGCTFMSDPPTVSWEGLVFVWKFKWANQIERMKRWLSVVFFFLISVMSSFWQNGLCLGWQMKPLLKAKSLCQLRKMIVNWKEILSWEANLSWLWVSLPNTRLIVSSSQQGHSLSDCRSGYTLWLCVCMCVPACVSALSTLYAPIWSFSYSLALFILIISLPHSHCGDSAGLEYLFNAS